MSVLYNLKEEKHTILPVFIEGYGFAFRGTEFLLAELGGVVRLALLENLSQPYYDVPPTSKKLFITGKGNSPKNIMLEQTYKKFGIGSEVLKDDNQVDAFGLAQFGIAYLAWLAGEITVDKKQQDSFKKITGCDTIDCTQAYL